MVGILTWTPLIDGVGSKQTLGLDLSWRSISKMESPIENSHKYLQPNHRGDV